MDQTQFDTTSDPKVIFDTGSGRFFASILIGKADSKRRISAGEPQAVDIALSDSADPSGGWSIFQVAKDNTNLLDQPKIGASLDKVTVSINVNGRCRSIFIACYEVVYVLQKSDVLAGMSPRSNSFTNGHQFNAIPAQLMSPTSIQYVLYNVKDFFGNSNLEVMAITGNPGGGNVALNQSGIGIASTDSPPKAPQPGSTDQIDAGDDAIESAVWQNGQLWAVGGDSCVAQGSSTVLACIRVNEVAISGTSPTLLIDRDIRFPSNYIFYPAVMVDSANNVFISVTQASTSQFASATALGLPSGDVNATQVLTRPDRTGSGPYKTPGDQQRWGDYSGAARDPVNPADVLLAAEYGPIDGTPADWKTAIGRYTFTAPAISSINPSSGPGSFAPPACDPIVTITGSEFASGATTVAFGNVALAPQQVNVINPSTLTVVPPGQPAPLTVPVIASSPAGSSNSNLTYTYLADTTPPTTTAIESPTPNAAGWNKTNPTITLTAADNACGSGTASITYSTTPTAPGSGGQTIPTTTVPGSSASFQVTVEGQTTVNYFATDNAGNVEATHQLIVKLDRTPPTATTTLSRPGDHNGWYNHPFTATAAGTDSPAGIASGLASCTVTPASGPGANPYTACDEDPCRILNAEGVPKGLRSQTHQTL